MPASWLCLLSFPPPQELEATNLFPLCFCLGCFGWDTRIPFSRRGETPLSFQQFLGNRCTEVLRWRAYTLRVKWCRELCLPLRLTLCCVLRVCTLGVQLVFHLKGASEIMALLSNQLEVEGLIQDWHTMWPWAVPPAGRARHGTPSLAGPPTTSPCTHAAHLSQPHFAFCLLS